MSYAYYINNIYNPNIKIKEKKLKIIYHILISFYYYSKKYKNLHIKDNQDNQDDYKYNLIEL